MDAIPAARRLPTPIRQRPLPRTAVAAEQESHAVAHDGSKRRRRIMLHREPEERREEMDRLRNVVDDITHTYGGHISLARVSWQVEWTSTFATCPTEAPDNVQGLTGIVTRQSSNSSLLNAIVTDELSAAHFIAHFCGQP